jgi:hypothetical protein
MSSGLRRRLRAIEERLEETLVNTDNRWWRAHVGSDPKRAAEWDALLDFTADHEEEALKAGDPETLQGFFLGHASLANRYPEEFGSPYFGFVRWALGVGWPVGRLALEAGLLPAALCVPSLSERDEDGATTACGLGSETSAEGVSDV